MPADPAIGIIAEAPRAEPDFFVEYRLRQVALVCSTWLLLSPTSSTASSCVTSPCPTTSPHALTRPRGGNGGNGGNGHSHVGQQ